MLLVSVKTVLNPAQEIDEAKLAALVAVEASRTFQRHEQLRAFLRFVCEYEMAGRGDDLHEYLIGVEVLGQKPGYSTMENSVVRNRAHSLRKKLAEYYAGEGADAALRIEIPKGSYSPHYINTHVPALSTDTVEQALPPEEQSSKAYRTWLWVATALLLCTVCLGIGYRWGESRTRAIDDILRQAWGPLVSRASHPVICIANAPELFVRSLPDSLANYKQLPDELNLKAWYAERYPLKQGDNLYFVPNHNSPLWGDAASAITLSRLLAHAGADTEVLPERVQSAFALRNRNAILIGRPEISPAAAVFLKDMYYNIHYSPEIHDQEVYWTDASTGQVKELSRKPGTVHGLITVINEQRNDGVETRLVIISGENSAGSLAAAEYFSCASCMREFKDRLRVDGIKDFPRMYQIVLSTEQNEVLPFNYSLETYRVIQR